MTRIVKTVIVAVFAGSFLSDAGAQAQTAPSGLRKAEMTGQADTDMSGQRRRTVRVPVYPRDQWEPDVYPHYNPGPNAVRVCNATYVQENRPTGTVITPRMSCYWRRG